MTQKTHHLTPTKFDSKTRRAPAHDKHVKVNKARDHDWKQETNLMKMFGYTNDAE